MSDDRQTLGQIGEALALKHLKRQGYKILAQNYRNSLGEIDIIAQHRQTIVFIEVKTRRFAHIESPKAAVTARKQRKISMVALSYLRQIKKPDAKARFDVVAVTAAGARPKVELVKNAFELAYP